MPDRQFEILVVGRANGDLILGPEYACEPTANHPGIAIRKDNREHVVVTSETPGKDTDKVTALTPLDEIVGELDFLFRWGGGAINSAIALADLGTTSSQMGVTTLTPTRPDLFFAGRHYDLIAMLEERGIKQQCMNLQGLTYNLIGTLGSNKIIIRNRQPESRFLLNREHRGTIEQYINPAKGVLINSLNHPDMTKLIVQYIHSENERSYNALKQLGKEATIEDEVNGPGFFSLPQHRKVFTVVTGSKTMQKYLVNDIYPYSGLIFNHEDVITLFHNASSEADRDYSMALHAMAQLRCGIPTEHGVKRHIEDPHNNIYVTLGKEGHLVAIGDTAYHLRISDEISSALNREIRENKSSTTGAGDAFAAGIIHQETIGRASDVEETAAVANTAVCKFLGLNRIVHPSDVHIIREYNLKESYLPGR